MTLDDAHGAPKAIKDIRALARRVVHKYDSLDDILAANDLITRRLGAVLKGRATAWNDVLAGAKRNTLNLVVKPVGDACDFACSYCPTVRFDKSGRFDVAMLNDLLSSELLLNYSDIAITWHGGEPLLAGRRFFEEAHSAIRAAAKGKLIEISLQTNGFNLNESWISFLRDQNVFVGVSVDGPINVHDRCRRTKRGYATYDIIIRNVEKAVLAGLNVGILMVVSDDPDDQIAYENFFKEWRLSNVELEIKYSLSGSSWPAEYGTWLGSLFERWLNGSLGPLISPKLFKSVFAQTIIGAGQLCWIGGTCRKHVGVNPKGIVTPCCDRLVGDSFWQIGRIGEQMIDEMLGSKAIEDFFSKANSLHEDCISCDFRPVCNGGCTYYRIGRGGRKFVKDPMCAVYKAFFGTSVQVIRRELEKLT